MSNASSAGSQKTYYMKNPGGSPIGPLGRSEVLNRAVPGTLVTLGQRWVTFGDHPDFAQSSQMGVHPSQPPVFSAGTGPGCWVALWAFLLPGLPQMVLGQTAKGIFVMVLVIGIAFTPLFFLSPIFGIIFIVDAAKLGSKLRRTGHVDPWEFMPR